jgi:hypothetical protein
METIHVYNRVNDVIVSSERFTEDAAASLIHRLYTNGYRVVEPEHDNSPLILQDESLNERWVFDILGSH